MGEPWSLAHDGLLLHIRLTPRGGRDALEGIEHLADGRVVACARVRAAPENGKANAALMTLIASAASIAPSFVSLVGGGRSRLKTVHCRGQGAALEAALRAALRGTCRRRLP